MELRPYQLKAVQEVYAAWESGKQNVLLRIPTGGGKTACFAYIINQFPHPALITAHRTELVSQASLALARYGVYHNIIAPKQTIQDIIKLHMIEYKQNFYDPTAKKYVAGIDTLNARSHKLSFLKHIRLLIQDEAHHTLRENKWGKVAALFPNAVGLYPTATPSRADGKGLGRQSDGIIDHMVHGCEMRELIHQNYLTDYTIIAPPNSLDLSHVHVTAGGDYSLKPLSVAIQKARITGNIVDHYLKVAAGELGITFAVNIESCIEITNAYRAAGVPAETISSKTPPLVRAQIMRKFRNREILQLVNVDILGEGVDVPAVRVCSFARPTFSLNTFMQQAGRALRPYPGKDKAIIIDHVNNWVRHGLPDMPRVWTLDRRERRARTNTIDNVPLRTCLNAVCMAVYPRISRNCPHCGFYSPPKERSTPEHVDGDLIEIDPVVLAQMRGEIARVDGAPRIPQRLNTIAQLGIANTHRKRQEAQVELRLAISTWAAVHHVAGKNDSEIYRLFYFTFGIDVMTAQTIGATKANALKDKIYIDANVTNR